MRMSVVVAARLAAAGCAAAGGRAEQKAGSPKGKAQAARAVKRTICLTQGGRVPGGYRHVPDGGDAVLEPVFRRHA